MENKIPPRKLIEVLNLKYQGSLKAFVLQLQSKYMVTEEMLMNVDDGFDIGMMMLDQIRNELLIMINQKRDLLEKLKHEKRPLFMRHPINLLTD